MLYVFSRFKECQNRFEKEKRSLWWKGVFFMDWMIAFFIHGASINDYFAYRFFYLRHSGRKEFITFRRHKKIQAICNPTLMDRELCRDKACFNRHFSAYLGRNWLDVSTCTFQEFCNFFKNYEVVFLKDISSFRGIGIKKLQSSDVNVEKLYQQLQTKKEANYILEEPIIENDELASFHPWSINTIRIVTVYNEKTDEVYLMNARIRMGNNKNNVDNFHFQGIGANIDIQSGVINSLGYDMFDNTYICHPLTGKQIVGFQIPCWEECKLFVEKAARMIPTVRYIGWDVVIGVNGNFSLIEANDNADHDFQQLYNKGLWKEYRKVLSKIH